MSAYLGEPRFVAADQLNELLATGERLKTNAESLNQFVSTKNIHRKVSELNEAARSLRKAAPADIDSEDHLKSVRMLSKKGFDSLRWMNEVQSLQVEGVHGVSDSLEATDIDSYLAHHHDIIILSAIDEAKRGAEDDVQELHRRWASHEWATSRRQFIESLGHRSQGWTSSALVSAAANANANAGAQYSQSSSMSVAPSTPFSASSLPTLRDTTAAATATGGGSFAGLTPAKAGSTAVTVAGPSLSALRQRQALVVRSLNQEVYRSVEGTAVASTPAKDLASVIDSRSVNSGSGTDSDGLSEADLIGYQNVLEMFAEIVGENETPKPAGYFSTVCFTADEVAAGALLEKRRYLTAHTIRFLQDEMWRQWSVDVDQLVRAGQVSVPASAEGESRNNRLRAYVRYLWSVGDITPVRDHVLSPIDGATPVWAYVYHCLRIGELAGAVRELEACFRAGERRIEQSALIVLRSLLHIMSSSPPSAPINSIAPLSAADADTLNQAMDECVRLYEEESRKDERAADPYREQVLNLLSLHNQNSLSDSGIPRSTLDDFLWGNLWFVQWKLLVHKATASAASLRSRDASDGVLALYDSILEYGGAEYFDKDMEAPFNYATVLFSCQRFGDAIAHLWQSGRTVPALHLTVLCLHYGLVLPHQPLAHNPRHTSAAMLHSRGVGIGNDITPASLLQMFFSLPMLQAYPEVSVDYFVSLNLRWHYHVQGMDLALQESHKLKSQAVITTLFQNFLTSVGRGQIAKLVGEPRDEGSPSDESPARTGGWLDVYLTNAQVSNLLSLAAYHLLTVRRESEEALSLFQLAGRHTEVIDELCNRLSSVMCVPGADREFWRDTAIGYYEKYIRTGLGSVQRCLESDNRTDLRDTFEVLLYLFSFIDTSAANRWVDALGIIDSLGLLPLSDEQVSAAAQKFATLDAYVRRVADDVLVHTVECAKNLYLQHKAEGGSSYGRGVLSERDQEKTRLRDRVKALVMFAGLVKSRLNKPNTAARIARIEDILS